MPIEAHSDFQGGKVTGMTLDAIVDRAYAPREDGHINKRSMEFPDKEYFHLTHELEYMHGYLGSYIQGAVHALQQDYALKVDLYVIFNGKHSIGRLSSSAVVNTASLMTL